jgi:hypothetical protein
VDKIKVRKISLFLITLGALPQTPLRGGFHWEPLKTGTAF